MQDDTPSSRFRGQYGGRLSGKTAAMEADQVIATRRGRIPTEQKWLEFKEEPVPSTHTTRRVSIWTNDRARHLLGIVQWNNAWRRYAFEPCFPTVFEHECLRHIADLVAEMSLQHKARAGTATARAEASYELSAEPLVAAGVAQNEAMARTRERGKPRNAPERLTAEEAMRDPDWERDYYGQDSGS